MDIKVDKNTVIVFDLDDTLYNELDYLISAYKYIAASINKSDSKRIFYIMFSMYRKGLDVFSYLSKNYNLDKKDLVEMYRNHFPMLALNNYVEDIINILKKKGISLALLTDGRSITQKNKLKSLGLENIFDYVSISEEIGFTKPSMQGFKLIEEKFKKDNYYYIADNLKKDFIAPKKLGWETICIIDSGKNIHYSDLSKLKDNQKPNSYIFSFNELNII